MIKFLKQTAVLTATLSLAAPAFGTMNVVEQVTAQTLPPSISTLVTASSRIAIVRLDEGRMIPVPHDEAYDWSLLMKRQEVTLDLFRTGQLIPYLPLLIRGQSESDNTLDEIRLAAANEGYSHVLFYGLGPDARWGSFAGRSLSETGLDISDDCASWAGADAKALLTDSYTGDVLGSVTSDQVRFHIGDLADAVGLMLDQLRPTPIT